VRWTVEGRHKFTIAYNLEYTIHIRSYAEAVNIPLKSVVAYLMS